MPLAGQRGASPLSVGWTPWYRAPALGGPLGLRRLYVEDEGRNPLASLKDRASAVVVARAVQAGEQTIAGASTADAATSLACMMAAGPWRG